MPYIDFVSKDDRVSLWYITNSRTGNVSDFDPEKPTVVMYAPFLTPFSFSVPNLAEILFWGNARMHPLFLDSSWLTNQFEDARLSSRYNLMAFDMRCAGRSSSRPNGAHDTWVDAADLAFALIVRTPPTFSLPLSLHS